MFGTSIAAAALALAVAATPFGTTLDGKALTSLGPPESLVVLVFVASDCPVSNRYLPEVQRLKAQFPQATFYLVFSNPGDSAGVVRRHLAAFGQALPALLDPNQALVALVHARVTPEAAILLPQTRRVAYLGRIDDRYVSFGHERSQATHHDLADAIAAALNHQFISQPTVRPVGCSIVPR